METIIHLLRETIGLDASSIGAGAIQRAVQHRLRAANFPDLPQYREHLRGSPEELRALIEAVVVPETWFFRDPGAFAGVAAHARGMDPAKPLRYLCAPCSTGEEPFSLAMALCDAGFPADRFQIEAVDISSRALAQAARATYGRNSFRSEDLRFRDRYFKKTPDGWELELSIRRMVSFRPANLLDDSNLHGLAGYDAIFCRNLLIYFDEAMQSRVMKTLMRLLAADGLLCVAPAESGLVLRHGFEPSGLSLAFAFRKNRPKPAAVLPRVAPGKIPTGVSPAKIRHLSKHPVSRKSTDRLPATKPGGDAFSTLAEARRLADEGRFAEVCAICQTFLQTHGASAEAYYLLALVSDASNRPEEAAALYRKALYVEPEHAQALAHFSLLAEKLGDRAASAALRGRALRLEANLSAE